MLRSTLFAASRAALGIGFEPKKAARLTRLQSRVLVLAGGFDEANEFGAGDAGASAELDELGDLVEQRAAFGGAGDADSVTLAEFEETLVAEQSERAEDGVCVDAHDGGQVPGGWQAVAGLGFAVGDRLTDLRSDLLVKERRVVTVDLDIQHCAI
jgi:hypothetical protein